jgi:hypothetical protein
MHARLWSTLQPVRVITSEQDFNNTVSDGVSDHAHYRGLHTNACMYRHTQTVVSIACVASLTRAWIIPISIDTISTIMTLISGSTLIYICMCNKSLSITLNLGWVFLHAECQTLRNHNWNANISWGHALHSHEPASCLRSVKAFKNWFTYLCILAHSHYSQQDSCRCNFPQCWHSERLRDTCCPLGTHLCLHNYKRIKSFACRIMQWPTSTSLSIATVVKTSTTVAVVTPHGIDTESIFVTPLSCFTLIYICMDADVGKVMEKQSTNLPTDWYLLLAHWLASQIKKMAR